MFKTSVRTAYLVDDNEVDLFVQSKFIQLSQFAENIITYQSPKKALEAISDGQVPDVIFLDLNMPDMDGFQFLDRMRDTARQARVVILSSSNNPTDRSRAREYACVVDFITKPLSMEGLESLRGVLAKAS